MEMSIDTEVLAAAFLDLASRSIGFDQGEWEVAEAWVQPGDGGEEVHVRIAKRRDRLPGCPKRGGPRACATRGSAPGATSASGG